MTKIESKDIDSKETLHEVLDEMITAYKGKPSKIGMCESYRQYDDNMYWYGNYKGLTITHYPAFFAEGKIMIQ